MSTLPVLETERLILRPFSLEDANAVQRLVGDKDVAEPTSGVPHPYEDGMAEQWIATHEAAFVSLKGITLALMLKATHSLIGAMSLLNISIQHRHAELGYWIGKPYWNQGLGTEAAQAMIHYGFRALNLNRIQGRCLRRNIASGRVMEKAGMKYEGCWREQEFKAGKFEDVVFYGALAFEWSSR